MCPVPNYIKTSSYMPLLLIKFVLSQSIVVVIIVVVVVIVVIFVCFNSLGR